ncbi:hypothetical protein KSP39_PZI018922 [Platanthera zijinensis]|uniref:Uncharacterized protein n=1 Tax=Platanthera zijinensis TaxID=2320716 RepID=A0AAP0B4L4_9ASPA
MGGGGGFVLAGEEGGDLLAEDTRKSMMGSGIAQEQAEVEKGGNENSMGFWGKRRYKGRIFSGRNCGGDGRSWSCACKPISNVFYSNLFDEHPRGWNVSCMTSCTCSRGSGRSGGLVHRNFMIVYNDKRYV